MKKSLITALSLIIILFGASFTASAGGLVVKGCVKDMSGEPLPGVVVTAGNAAATTDLNGNYQITVPEGTRNPQLSFSMLGMKPLTEAVRGRSVVNVEMEEKFEELEEVIAVGYGSMRKSDITGSISTIKVDENEAFRQSSLDQLLKGNAAGVDVINSSEAPDAGVSIRIRGITSINGSSEPLYVIDGVIMASHSVSTGIDADEEVNGLMGLSPNDIASIQILKDASATAIYGAAGANGVVLITTKQSSNDKARINFNAGVDFCVPYGKMNVLNFDEFVSYLQVRSDAGNTPSAQLLKRMFENYGTPEQKLVGKIVDWQDAYIRNSVRQKYYFSISGNPSRTWYSASASYNKSDGVVMNTSNDQLTARLNVNVNISPKLKFESRVNFAYIHSQMMQGASTAGNGASTSFIKSLVIYRPWTDTSFDDDDLTDETNISSPDKWVYDSEQRRSEIRVTPNAKLRYKIVPWLELITYVGADYHALEFTKFRGATVAKTPAAGAVSDSRFYNLNWDTTLNFKRKFAKKHDLSGVLGFALSRNSNKTSLVTSDEITQSGLRIRNIDSSPVAMFAYSETNESKMSFFARAVYNYNERYVLTLTGRADGSSRFAPRNRFSFFPSAAAAWRISQEPWFNVPVISSLKLRLGWGQVGNCSVKPYQYMSTYGSDRLPYHFNDAQYITTFGPTLMTNEDLKWETTSQWNAGIDFGMWKGRLSLSVDAYYKNTYDLLQSRNITYNAGFGSMYVNQGSISNRGLEITLDATPVVTRDVEWGIKGNISFNRNRLEDLGYEGTLKEFYFTPGQKTEQRFYTGQNLGWGGYYGESPVNVFMQGQPIGLFYGYKTDGLVQEGEYGVPFSANNFTSNVYPGPGSIKYVDMNGDGYIDSNDRTRIGDANAKFTYGFSTSLTFRKWTLSASFQGSFGNQLFNMNRAPYYDSHKLTSPMNVKREAFYDAWTVVDPTNMYVGLTDPTKYYGTLFENVWHTNEQNYITDRDVEDASYLRLSNISLSYTLDLPQRSALKRAIFSLTVGNAFIWTNYSGFSPIVSSYRLSSQRIGVDGGGYPASRTYGFDVKLSF